MNIKRIFKYLKEGKIPPPGDVPPKMLDLLAEIISFRAKLGRLSSTERMLATISHKEPDRVPVNPLVCAAGRHLVDVSFQDYAQTADSAAEVFAAIYDFFLADALILLWDLSVEAGDLGQKLVFPEQSTPHPDYVDPFIKSVDDYRKVKPISLKDAKRMNEFIKLCRMMVDRIGQRTLVTGFIYGPLGVLSMMRGNLIFFQDCVNHPKEIKSALAAITEVLIEYAQAQCEAGVPAVCIDTLYSSYSGVSKKLWLDLEAPFVKELSRAIRSKGVHVLIHNCGHGPYFDVILEATEATAFSFAHLPDDCNSEKELKERYGHDITLIGYVKTPLLSTGNPYQVMEECKRQIDVFADGGGFVLAPGCEYPPNLSLVNALAMIKAAEKFG